MAKVAGRAWAFLHRNGANVVLGGALAIVLGLPFLLRPSEAVTGAGTPAPDLPERELTVLSVHSETIRREFESGFSRWAVEHLGQPVRIEWLDVGGTTQAVRYVEDQFERTPQGIRIDLFFGGGADPYLHFADLGYLERCEIAPEVLEAIPPSLAGTELYDPEHRWFGTCLAGFGLMFNRPVLEFLSVAEPQTWGDLGDSQYFRWVASADPRHSGSIHMAYEIILQAYGWDEGWGHVMRIGANCRGFSREASRVPADVSSGEAACGMAIDFYALRAIAEAGGDRLGFVLPRPLTVINPDGIGMLKGAPHRELAQQFVEFILSEAGQKLWALNPGAPGGPQEFALFRLPLIPGLAARYGDAAAVRLDPFTFGGKVDFDLEKKNLRRNAMSDLFGAVVVDVHEELAAAWEAVRHLPPDHPSVRELLAPPVSEEELLRLAAEEWGDPRRRADTVAAWSRKARRRYRRLAEGN
jgi:ABC-type Fe3+ transport system substrate-binding protein